MCRRGVVKRGCGSRGSWPRRLKHHSRFGKADERESAIRKVSGAVGGRCRGCSRSSFGIDLGVEHAITTSDGYFLDQAETNRLWEALIEDGGTENRCGLFEDHYGLPGENVAKRAVKLPNGPVAAKLLTVAIPER